MSKASSAALIAALSTLALGVGSAQAAVQVVGGTLAAGCSKAAFAGESTPRSIEVCGRALSDEALLVRDRAATHVNRGIMLMRNGNLDAARRDFERAVMLEPDLGEGYANRGSVWMVEGRFPEAVADFNRALEVGMAEPERAYFNRGIAREWMDDAKGAYLDYRKAAQLNPEWPSPREQMIRFTVVSRR